MIIGCVTRVRPRQGPNSLQRPFYGHGLQTSSHDGQDRITRRFHCGAVPARFEHRSPKSALQFHRMTSFPRIRLEV